MAVGKFFPLISRDKAAKWFDSFFPLLVDFSLKYFHGPADFFIGIEHLSVRPFGLARCPPDSRHCPRVAQPLRRGAFVRRTSWPGRILRSILIFLALSSLSACIASRMRNQGDGRPVGAGMEVIAHSATEQHQMNVLGLFPFSSPPEVADSCEKITTAFQEQLLRERPFREVKLLPYSVKADAEALWYGRNEGCDLVMVPVILYLMDGTGAMPTRLVIRTRILDVRTGKTLWDLKQDALSEPGMDIDLTWTTISGEPARRYHSLADDLARRFADFLVQPYKMENNGDKKVLLPITKVQ
jgi:hypothetical protein